ncbi:MAG: helix-turn-helix domain-containing protein [Terriglobales bacterium]
MHRHTLRQALAAAGTSFENLQRTVILRLLRRGAAANTPIKDIWTRAGFSSASSFARYVRRATGNNPTELRRALISGQLGPQSARLGLDLLGGYVASRVWVSRRHNEED